MNSSKDAGNLQVADITPFVGAKDFSVSRDFYCALGWQINFESPEIIELQLGGRNFYLQNYYQKHWCDNTMLHITVTDAQAWFDHVSGVLADKKYGVAKVREPVRQDYGALVTFVWDPVGVLLHFAQFD